ncbi:MAG TPA: lysine--tRNA ligase, partial [Pyrinomonadaceae bacterium]|nr:lysine--tRNA ligase [Pyrinomonadaceae bacterium]
GERPHQEVKDALNAKLEMLGNVRVSGRLTTTPRTMGKAAFVHISDGKNRLQIYVRKDDAAGVRNDFGFSNLDFGLEETSTENPKSEIQIPESPSGWDIFKLLDGGDFVGVEGFLFLTNTGELSVHVMKLQFLSKSLLPMPDKMHGIADPEIRQRQRYADLIASSLQVEHEGLTTRQVFEIRAKVISSIRRFLEDAGYIEVETPMLTPKATGAAAKPFVTHHNALDIDLYARIAPELYLKRLTVGGFEKVYELNRNFRNEGISYKHNPEFTMLEFYCAYMDVNGMMDFCEELLRQSIQEATGGLKVNYEGREIDFFEFERISMVDAVLRYLPTIPSIPVDRTWFNDTVKLRRLLGVAFAHSIRIPTEDGIGIQRTAEEIWNFGNEESILSQEYQDESILVFLFEEFAEPNLVQPTFIIDFPKSISPLSKASPANPEIAERFELFINGMEVANGFSELNDPQEQYERFLDQMQQRERGDDEAMVLDEDYIRALSYGMPPAAGIGIGIDRLVMLLTNKHSIRDVILFPHLRPERKAVEESDEAEGQN